MSDTKEQLDYPSGLTFDVGRYRFTRLLRGTRHNGLWLDDAATPRPVWIIYRRLRKKPELEALLRYSAPGIAPLLFLGPPDQGDDELKREHTAFIEEAPSGVHLGEAGRLTTAEVVALGISLCDLIVAWAAACNGEITRGLRPETIFVTGEPGSRRFSAAAPRAYFLLGGDGAYGGQPCDSFDPPAASVFQLSPEDGLFTVALTLWFATTGVHPYSVAGDAIENNIWKDRRLAFTGDGDLGELLEQVLVADPQRRLGVAAFRAGLVALGRRRGVEL